MFRQKHTVRIVSMVLVLVPMGVLAAACGKITPETTAANTPTESNGSRVSDEMVSAAARIAYENYLEVADQILTDGGDSPERIETVATEEFARVFQTDVAEYSNSGLRTVGSTKVNFLRLQAWSRVINSYGVTTYICDDVSGIDVLGPDGESQVSPNRDPTTPYEVAFEGDDFDGLTVSAKNLWTGADFCEK